MNQGINYTIGVCCLWPIIVHLALMYGLPYLLNRDWKNIKTLWNKDEE